jgi:pSer/pThr/pTyr-binding forkhead associated (FHA) protein
MGWFIEIKSGSLSGQKIWLRDGQTMQFGRTEAADCSIVDDELLSRLHFAVDSEPNQCRIRDLGSRNGTFLNGDAVKVAILTDGDQIEAGRTSFHVHFKAIGNSGDDMLVPAAKTDTEKAWSMDRLQPSPDARPDDPPTMRPAQAPPPLNENNWEQTLSIDAYRTPFSSGKAGMAGGQRGDSPIVNSPMDSTPMQTMDSEYGEDQYRNAYQHLTGMAGDQDSNYPSVNPNAGVPQMAYTQSMTANGLVCFKPYRKQTRAVDIGRMLSANPLFYMSVNLSNMEREARTFFSSSVYGAKFEKISSSLILVSQSDSIDILELFHRALGREAMVGIISRLSKHQLAEQLKTISHSLDSPRQFLYEINHSVPENLRNRLFGIDAVMVEDDESDGWSIILAPNSSLNWQSIGFANPPIPL